MSVSALTDEAAHAERERSEVSLPIVRRIQASFRDRIRSGELPPGTKLPSMRNLSTEFGCSLGIVKQAVTTLAAQGFLRSSPRRGVFVADGPPAGREVAIVLPHLEIKRLHLAMSGIRAGLAAGLRDGSYRIGIHAGLAEPAAVDRAVDAAVDRPLPAASASEAVLAHLCSAQVAGVMLLLPSAGEHDHLRRRLRDRGVPVVTVEIASRTRSGGGAEDVVTFNPDALAAM
ncbi:MAG: winged helix-turn-helix domain-containing protein, partial [Planctomycetota bacterium]